MKPTESLDLEAIQARADAATPGPWGIESDVHNDDWPVVVEPTSLWVVADWGAWLGYHRARQNAQFVAHAREDMPALVAEVRRLRRELETQTKVADMSKQNLIPADPCTCSPTRESVMTPDGHIRCEYITFHEPGCPSRIESTTTG